jgi:hypothetical protein
MVRNCLNMYYCIFVYPPSIYIETNPATGVDDEMIHHVLVREEGGGGLVVGSIGNRGHKEENQTY